MRPESRSHARSADTGAPRATPRLVSRSASRTELGWREAAQRAGGRHWHDASAVVRCPPRAHCRSALAATIPATADRPLEHECHARSTKAASYPGRVSQQLRLIRARQLLEVATRALAERPAEDAQRRLSLRPAAARRDPAARQPAARHADVGGSRDIPAAAGRAQHPDRPALHRARLAARVRRAAPRSPAGLGPARASARRCRGHLAQPLRPSGSGHGQASVATGTAGRRCSSCRWDCAPGARGTAYAA